MNEWIWRYTNVYIIIVYIIIIIIIITDKYLVNLNASLICAM